MMRRTGQMMKYVGIGAFLSGLFIASMLMYINYIDDLETSTRIKSEAVAAKLGVAEEVMNARCNTHGRAIINLTAIEEGRVHCINSSRPVGLSYAVKDGGGISYHNFSIKDGEVTELSADESIRTGDEPIRSFPVVYRDVDGEVYRGLLHLAVSGSGWQCKTRGGRCIPEGNACAQTEESDCGGGRICCIPQQTTPRRTGPT